VLETLDEIATGDIRKQLRSILGSFLFRGDDVFKSVSVLSGGEKSRLALARMLLKPSNFLILDEPTNHLDMNSKKVLMNALNGYEGTILLISHDREFLDGIVNKIIEVKNKNIKTYFGNCSDYLASKAEEADIAAGKTKSEANNETESKTKKTKEQKRAEAESRNKLYNLTKPVKTKIAQIEKDIKVKEEKLKQIEADMGDESFYKDAEKVKKANKEFGEIKEKLTVLYHQWMEQSSRLTELESKIK
jgi:ATP-binding cassette subfamily F protein 3